MFFCESIIFFFPADLLLIESLESSTGKLTSDRIFDEIKRMTKRDGKNYTEEDAIHEIVARASEDMFANSAAVREILDSMTAEEKQNFVGKVKEILTQFKQWINEFLGLYKSDSEEAEAFGEELTEKPVTLAIREVAEGKLTATVKDEYRN